MRFLRWSDLRFRVALVLGLVLGSALPLGLAHALAPSSAPARGAAAESPASPDPSAPVPAASGSPPPTVDPLAPRFPIVRSSGAMIGGVYTALFVPLPDSARERPSRYPVVVLLRDPNVDASQYTQLGHDVAAYGSVVVVPPGRGRGALAQVRAWARTADTDPTTPAEGLVDPSRILVLAHGAADVGASSTRGAAAVAVYAPGAHASVPPSSIPALTICGGAGPVSAACAGTATPTRSFVTIDAADPLTVTDEGRRGVRSREPIDPGRDAAIGEVARWTGWWLLAQVGVGRGEQFLSEMARAPDPGVHARTVH